MSNFETDRISIRYHIDTNFELEHYTNMFMEDFSNNAVQVYESNDEIFQYYLEPVNEKFEQILCELLPSFNQRYKIDFNDFILETIEYISKNLVYHGFIALELVTGNEINKNKIYRLEPIFGKEVKIEGNNVIQVIHKEAVKINKIPKRVVIPYDKCFVIDFPKSLGGKENYLKFIKEFKELGKKSPYMNFENSLAGQEDYNMKDHQKIHELELWRKSKNFNWHHRERYGETFSGYYYKYRYMKFQKSNILLRIYIIDELIKLISWLSQKFEANTKLKTQGVFSPEKIDELLKKWETGELNPRY